MNHLRPPRWGCALALSAGVLSGGAFAADIVSGTYQLHNHPDGNAVPPPYGLRLDELYDATGGHDIFTFDFDHPSSDVKLDYDYDAQTIAIYGHAYGGRDSGGGYFADPYLGVYEFSFLYDVGVGPVPGDDDVWADALSGSNLGSIESPTGDIFELSCKSNGEYNFRLGDENDDNGHRGFDGISGWGWLMVDGIDGPGDQDWLFTAELIPEPSSLMLLALGAGLLRRRSAR